MTKNKTRKMTIRVIQSLSGPPDDAKTSNIEYTVSQEKNLYLAVYKNGSRSWRFKMKFQGKRLFITISRFVKLLIKWQGEGEGIHPLGEWVFTLDPDLICLL